MKKKPWNTPPHERDRRTDAQKIAEMKALVADATQQTMIWKRRHEEMTKLANGCHEDAMRYRVLRVKEVIVMDGEAKYLTHQDLDEYCDKTLDAKNPWWQEPSKIFVPVFVQQQAQQLLQNEFDKAYRERNANGIDTGSESQEADTTTAGHQTGVLRDADGDGLRELGSARFPDMS